MMTDEQRIEWLLELQDHPEQLTDAQLQQILADDEMRQLVQQLGFAKRAFKHDALKNDTPDVDAEWEKFAASHAEELEILDEGERLRVGDGTSGIHKPRFVLRLATHKIAASFIGVLLVSGIAFAAIQVVRNINYGASDRHEASHLPACRYSKDRHNPYRALRFQQCTARLHAHSHCYSPRRRRGV